MKSRVSETNTKMTDATPIPPTDQSKQSDEMMKQLLEQVKQLTEAQALQKKDNADLMQANEQFAKRAEEAEASGKRKREGILDGSVKEYFTGLMSKYSSELAPHEEKLNNMIEAMKSNSASEPMVQALACAAAASKGSVTELEDSYQANKKLKTELAELKKQYTEQSKPMFSKKEERVETVEAQASAVVAAPKEPAQFSSIFGGPVIRTPASMRGAGMREINPSMWSDLLSSAPSSNGGMPKIDAFMSMIKK